MLERIEKLREKSPDLQFWSQLKFWDQVFLEGSEWQKGDLETFLEELEEWDVAPSLSLQEEVNQRKIFLKAIQNPQAPLFQKEKRGGALTAFQKILHLDDLLLNGNLLQASRLFFENREDSKHEDLWSAYGKVLLNLQEEKKVLNQFGSRDQTISFLLRQPEKERARLFLDLGQKNLPLFQKVLKKEPVFFESILKEVNEGMLSLKEGSRAFWALFLDLIQKSSQGQRILEKLAQSPWWIRSAYEKALSHRGEDWPSWAVAWFWASRQWGGFREEAWWDVFFDAFCENCEKKESAVLAFLNEKARPFQKWRVVEEKRSACLKVIRLLEKTGRKMESVEALYKGGLLYLRCGNPEVSRQNAKGLFLEAVKMRESAKFTPFVNWALGRM